MANPQPIVIYGAETPTHLVDADSAAETMRTNLGISPDTIENTTIYADPKNNILMRGSAYPNTLGKIRFANVPELKDAPGPLVRISTRIRGKERDNNGINETLVHELEHVAQMERRDKKLLLGHLAIVGITAAGAIIGSKIGKNKLSRIGISVAGAGIGFKLGNVVAPHEIQARRRADIIKTNAVS